jgi:hypothetical protein
MSSRILAQSIAGASVDPDKRTLEITFVDLQNLHHTVAIPLLMAASAFLPILQKVNAEMAPVIGAPEFISNVQSWRVGRSNEAHLALVMFNGTSPLGLTIDQAKKLCAQLADEIAELERRQAPTAH